MDNLPYYYLVIVAIAAIAVILRKYYSERLRLGMVLCLLSPIGHFYMRGGFNYWAGLIILNYALDYVLGHNVSSVAFIVNILSSLLFWYRISKLRTETGLSEQT